VARVRAAPGTLSIAGVCVNGFVVDVNGAVAPKSDLINITILWGDTAPPEAVSSFPQSHAYPGVGLYTINITAYFHSYPPVQFTTVEDVMGSSPYGCYDLTVSTTINGQVDIQSSIGSFIFSPGSSGDLLLAYADTVNLTAVPMSPYVFHDWVHSAGISGPGGAPVATTSPSVTIEVNATGSINATYSMPPPPPSPPSSYPTLPPIPLNATGIGVTNGQGLGIGFSAPKGPNEAFDLATSSAGTENTPVNAIAYAPNTAFTIFGGNHSGLWVCSGFHDDVFNVTTGTGNDTFSLNTGKNASFYIHVNGNGTLWFSLSGGSNSFLNATNIFAGSTGGYGTEVWNIAFGTNSTVLLPTLHANDTINVVF
jgi:hypothetical protein